MLLRTIFGSHRLPSSVDLALLLLRLYVGVAMVQHGWPKIQNPTGWGGEAFPPFLQALAALAEFGGGVGLLLGVLMPLVCFGFICTMAVAVSVHVQRGDVMVGQSSWELAGLYLVLGIFWLLASPGRFSVDRWLFGFRDARHSLPVEAPQSSTAL